MLIIIFLEVSIAVVTVLGSMLVASQYSKNKNVTDLYVSLVLAFGALADLGMIFSQVAYSLQSPFAYLGFKLFMLSVLICSLLVWFHLSHIYNVRSRAVTVLLFAIAAVSVYMITKANVNIMLQEGVIVPIGSGADFFFAFLTIAAIVGIESILSAIGLRQITKEHRTHYRISRIAGVLFFIFLMGLISYMITRIMFLYFIMWLFAFFAMLYLFLFSMVTDDSPVLEHPMYYFRTRILFKLVIMIVLMIVLSLEGMGIISINIAKQALTESVIESYKRVAEDTIAMINKSKIDKSSEPRTLKAIAKILESTRIGDRGSVFLIAPSQTVYIDRSNNWISLGASQNENIARAFSGRTGGGEVNIFGEKVIAAFIPIKNLGWSIVVGQPISYAYSHITQMEGTFILFILIWIVLTVGVGIVFTRNIEDPVKELKKGMMKIAEGDLDYKINIDKIDEIGELANTLNSMTSELKQSQESLLRSERMASLGFMAAGMAHEIKNALVPLKTLTEMLTVSGGDQTFIAKFNELVPKEIDRINTLSTDLLHYSRPPEPVFEYLDVNEIVAEAAKFLEVQARKKNIKLIVTTSKVSQIKADKEKLMQAFTNIILNAIEAMSGGQISVSTYEKDDYVTVEISDNGPGIPQENIKKVFVPFFTTKKEGTGMGLAITQRIMADHGGTIDIRSTHGVGTTFYLSFPRRA